MDFKKIAEDCHKIAIEKGWWDKPRPVPELLCLIHSEVSEALEAYRKGDDVDLTEELADIIIRVCDMAGALDLDIETAVLDKNEFNKTRSYRHGNKVC